MSRGILLVLLASVGLCGQQVQVVVSPSAGDRPTVRPSVQFAAETGRADASVTFGAAVRHPPMNGFGTRAMAFESPAGGTAVAVMNSRKRPASVALSYTGKSVRVSMPAISIARLLWGEPGAAAPSMPKVIVARWPGDRKAAISLTFDDGIDTHLDIAGPILKKHGLAGTFFVNTDRGAWQHRLDAWKRLAADGNEIANHTVHHPCLLPAITPHSQDLTPAMMERDILDSARDIEEKIGAGRGLTFAYPCGNLTFGPLADQARNTPLFFKYVAECCFAARGYGAGGAAQDPDEMSVLNVTDLGVTEGKSFSELLEMAQPALRAGLWGVYGFHGVGGDWLSVSADSFDELTAYLARHLEIWTATFGDGVRYIQERKALGMEVARTGSGAIEIGLKWPLDQRIFDLPLTLRIEVPAAGATARADGSAVGVQAAEGGKALLVDVTPSMVKLVIDTTAR